MVRMKCLKALTYAGQKLKPGDPFSARGNKDARVLVAIGKAVRVAVSNFAPAKILPPVAVVVAPVETLTEATAEKVAVEEVHDEVEATMARDTVTESAPAEAPVVFAEALPEVSAAPAVAKFGVRRRNQSGAAKK